MTGPPERRDEGAVVILVFIIPPLVPPLRRPSHSPFPPPQIQVYLNDRTGPSLLSRSCADNLYSTSIECLYMRIIFYWLSWSIPCSTTPHQGGAVGDQLVIIWIGGQGLNVMNCAPLRALITTCIP